MKEGVIIKKLDLKRIKDVREAKNITLQDMADRLDLAARGSYQLKEQGKRRFYANEVPILCEILNLTFDEIYTDDSDEQEEKNYL